MAASVLVSKQSMKNMMNFDGWVSKTLCAYPSTKTLEAVGRVGSFLLIKICKCSKCSPRLCSADYTQAVSNAALIVTNVSTNKVTQRENVGPFRLDLWPLQASQCA